ELLYSTSPIRLMLLDENNLKKDSASHKIIVSIVDSTTFNIKDENNGVTEQAFGQAIDFPMGQAAIVPNSTFTDYIGKDIIVNYVPVDVAVDALLKATEVVPNKEKQSYIVNLSMDSELPEKAVLILNTLIKKYNEDISSDKSQVIRATTDFITSRLELVTKDLEAADKEVADFKDSHHVTDMTNEASLYLQSAAENERKLIEAQTQLQLAQMMKDVIQPDNSQLLPSNIGLQDASIEGVITQYNKLVLDRDDMLKSATEENPVVMNLNASLRELNRTLIISLNNYLKGIELQVSSLEKQLDDYKDRLSSITNQEKRFKPIARQQQIVESLYLFLLQKREEAEIKGAATPANLKIIDEAYGSSIPIAPRKAIILLGSLILGFIIPFGILYVKFLLDNKLHSKKDLEERLDVPLLVEIPSSGDKTIEENDRSGLAEAFRIL